MSVGVLVERRFVLATAVGLAIVVTATAANVVQPHAAALTSDLEAIGAGLAGALAVRAAWRLEGAARVGWSLIAGAAVCWLVGSLIPAIGGLAHAMSFAPAAGAIVLLPATPGRLTHRVRPLIDWLVVATTLVLVAWTLGLNVVREYSPDQVLTIGYPAADVFLLAMLADAARRTRPGSRLAIGILVAAWTTFLVADGLMANSVLRGGGFSQSGPAHDLRLAGYLLAGLAAMTAARQEPGPQKHDIPGEFAQLAIPWLGAGVAVIVNSVYVFAGRSPDPIMLGISCTVGALFVLSQVLATNDAVGWLVSSRRAEAQLRDRTKLLDEVIVRAPLGIARIGEDLCFIDVNPRLAEMLGVPESMLVGTSIARMMPDTEIQRAHERMALMRAGKLDRVEVDGEIHCPDGRTLFVHRSVTPVFGNDGKVAYYVVMFEDVTARHEVEQAAAQNLAALDRLNRLKSDFMAMVSHEFRTALTGIQGYSEVLATQDVSMDEVKQFGGDINTDALRLNRMINDMLDLDRIESGRLQLHVQPVDLNKLIEDAVDRTRMTTSRHEIRLSLDPNCTLIDADPDRLTQVMSNLLNNAVKYSPDGGKVVVASCAQDNRIEVSVQDSGEGIPPEFLPRIFNRFERYEAAGRSRAVGTGLGLAIAQQIIQLHRGRIWVESEPGHGSTFRFALPASQRSPDSVTPTPA